MTEQELRLEICRVGKSLFDRGYVHATAGNISVLLPESESESEGGGFLITPTDACLGFLEPEKLAKLDANGKQISGDKASKTFLLHRSIYEASRHTSSSASCIIHTHSSHCVALTFKPEMLQNSELLAPITPYFVMKIGHVPVMTYQRPGSAQTAHEARQIIEQYAAKNQPIRALMLPRLGPSVWHETPAQTMAVLEELEESAKLAFLNPYAKSLSESEIQALRESFDAVW